MHKSVIAAFIDFSKRFEGRCHHLYSDVKQLVTTGVGNLVDPVECAYELPWMRTDGSRATQDEIYAEWRRIKDDPTLPRRGARACEHITTLRLSDAAVDALVLRRLAGNEIAIRHTFPRWDEFPADGQLGVMSMAWACGPAGVCGFVHFCAACRSFDFAAAAQHCHISETGNPGVAPRNTANLVLFTNAAVVIRDAMDRTELYWPRDLENEKGTSI